MPAYTTLMHQWFAEVWNNADESAITQLLDDNAVVHGLPTDAALTGPAAFIPFYRNFRETFPVVHVDLELLINTNDFQAANCNVTAENAEGKSVRFQGISIIKGKDGKLVEAWNCFDFLNMYQQLGHRLAMDSEAVA